MTKCSSLLQRYSPARKLIYGALMANPTRQWSVKALVDELGGRLHREAVRANLYLMLNGCLLELGSGPGLTMLLTDQGMIALNNILGRWCSTKSRPDA